MTTKYLRGIFALLILLMVHTSYANIEALDVTINQAKILSKNSQKKILVAFSAHWCLPCQVMDQYVYSDKEIIEAINESFIKVKVNFDSPKDAEWFATYGVTCLPTLSILDSEGVELDRIEGSMTKIELLQFLGKVPLSNSESTLLAKAKMPRVQLKGRNLNRNIVAEASGQQAPTLIGIKEGKLKKSNNGYVPAAHKIDKFNRSSNFNPVSKGTSIQEDGSSDIADYVKVSTSPITRKVNISPSGEVKNLNLRIQFGAFRNIANAKNLRSRLSLSENISTEIMEELIDSVTIFRVVQRDIHDLNEARKLFHRYQRLGIECFLKSQ